MSDTPRKQPPFTDCPKTEKVFPFKRMDDGHWYRYQSDAIDLCERLERENDEVQLRILTLKLENEVLHADFVNANGRCDMQMKEMAKLRQAIQEAADYLNDRKENLALHVLQHAGAKTDEAKS